MEGKGILTGMAVTEAASTAWTATGTKTGQATLASASNLIIQLKK